MPRITTTNVHVDDQSEALAFYTDVLGFVKKDDIDLGEARWLTVVSADDPDGTELLLEPSDHPAVEPYRSALVSDGIPSAMFTVDDVEAEYVRLTGLGVDFTQKPLDAGPVTTAVLDDTCGNLIQLVSHNEVPSA
jgi:predicted enzyme related to lactoylglutathione lyase